MNPAIEQRLLDELQTAEQSRDAHALETALGRLSLYYVAEGRCTEAASYYRRQALLVEQTTSADSRELGTLLHNMAIMCLLPADLLAEARTVLVRAKEIYSHHFRPEDEGIREIDRLLHELPT
jgi:hypothetical protein